MKLLRYYFDATPLFALADWLLGVNIRAVAFEGHPRLRAGYYAACVAGSVALHWRPEWSETLGLADSSINIALLCVSILAPYYALADQIGAGQTPGNPYTPSFVINSLISLTIWTIAFYGASRKGPARTADRGW